MRRRIVFLGFAVLYSSRFWPKYQYAVGQSPPGFDKQFVRDYLETLDWNKTPLALPLPGEVVEKIPAEYIEAFEQLTGSRLHVDR